jgi:chromosome segregation ATPase
LTIYPKKEISKLLEVVANSKSLKTATKSEFFHLKEKFDDVQVKKEDLESENYTLEYNLAQLRKQNESSIRKFEMLKTEKTKEILSLKKENEEKIKDLLKKIEDQTSNEKVIEENNNNLNLIRRKEHVIHTLKQEIEDMKKKNTNLNNLLKDQNSKYEKLYKEFKGKNK